MEIRGVCEICAGVVGAGGGERGAKGKLEYIWQWYTKRGMMKMLQQPNYCYIICCSYENLYSMGDNWRGVPDFPVIAFERMN